MFPRLMSIQYHNIRNLFYFDLRVNVARALCYENVQ